MENQKYIDAEDLTKLIKGLTIQRARKYINQLQAEMRKEGYWVPQTQKKLALYTMAKDKFGFK